MDTEQYVSKLQAQMNPAANPSNAIPMKKYMKGKFEYLGIKSPERVQLLSAFLKENGLPHPDNVSPIIKSLWGLPQREYQYCAMEIARKKLKQVNVDFLTTIYFLIESKSWWDTVDLIAATLAGGFFQRFPDHIPEVPDKWSVSPNMWFNRSAILYQLKYKVKTDTDILTRYIHPHTGSKEFFIQKAIGWSLREYSKTNPEWVLGFIAANKLKPLSRREGLKWLNRQGLGADN
jgi:3-methyladenine DNA glycosylase AlkD